MREFWHRLEIFLFSAQSDKWLRILRLGLGFQVILYAWSLRADWNYLLGGDGGGLIGRHAGEAILSAQSSFVPRLGWLMVLGAPLGLSEDTVLSSAWRILFAAGCGLIFGLFCRTFATTAWFLHLCVAKSGGLVSYGVDNLMTIGLFYLAVSPLPDRYALDHELRHLKLKGAWRHGFHRRVLQLHLCFIYFFGGITKCLGSDWWNGANLWRALTRPPFDVIAPEILVRFKYLLPALGISICLLEAGYPFFIWLKRTRFFWLGAVLTMHAAIGITMGMYLFALVMIVLNLAAFADLFIPTGAKDISTTVTGARATTA
jgi:hypothetical protein